MNFEVLQHFLASMMALIERLRAIYNDARQLTSSVGRQSLEFGQSSLSTVSEARSRVRQYPLTSISLVCFCLSLLVRRYGLRGGPPRRRAPAAASLADAFANTALDGAWRSR
mmetsp:Transcript_86920/g.261084  ORF Transcript_86920/g.261084 Transcript_86920/m.261084 type:complete len:112 (-) Transcript_86920:222-557(-)